MPLMNLEGVIGRDEAIQLVEKFDCQAPTKESTEIFLKYCSLDSKTLQKIIKLWTNQRIWSERDDFSNTKYIK